MGIPGELQEKVLELKDIDKARLVELLLESMDRPAPEITEKWAYQNGEVKQAKY